MAGGKESPRQKMIGMMYLVLTALLALNVSKEILNAFVTVNDGLEITIDNFEGKNEQAYAEFEKQMSLDRNKVKPYYDKAMKVKKLSADFSFYLKELKKELIVATEKVSKEIADTLSLKYVQNKDNYDIPTNILIGDSEDGSAGKARELKLEIEKLKTDLLAVLPEAKRDELTLGLNTADPINSFESNATWEVSNFYHTPLAATITLLSQLETDVKNAEADVIAELYSSVFVDNIPIDTFAAKVIPHSNYVLLGDEYKAEVMLAAYSKTRNPEITLGNFNESNSELIESGDSLRVHEGVGLYNKKATKEGIYTWGGIVKVKTNSGKIKEYPFKTEYIVAKPTMTVSADKMNVLYIDLNNPLSISVPGVPNEFISVSINNGSLSGGNGKFNARPRNGENAIVTVMAKINGETRKMGTMKYRVKRIPAPIPTIMGESSGSIKKSRMRLARKLSVSLPNFVYENVRYKTKSFNMIIVSRGNASPAMRCSGKDFTPEIRRAITQVEPGDKVIFEGIRANGPDGRTQQVNPLIFRVKR